LPEFRPTVLCKIVGVYQLGVHNRATGKHSSMGEQVAVMQNIFYNRRITKIFDLKGSLRGRFAAQIQSAKDDSQPDTPTHVSESSSGHRKRTVEKWERSQRGEGDERSLGSSEQGESLSLSEHGPATLLDGDFLEYTFGRPMPMTDRAKAVFQMSILNVSHFRPPVCGFIPLFSNPSIASLHLQDTLFLSIINVLDYSILVGIDEDNMELVVGIIDFMRQYDILKVSLL